MLKVTHLGDGVAGNVDKSVKTFASSQGLQYIFMQAASWWVNNSHYFAALFGILFGYVR